MTAPKLRLAGFKEPWECHAIRDIGTVITGSTPPRCDSSCWGGEFNWISSKDFKGKYISDSDEKITDKGKKHCRLLPAGSVLVTCIGASIGLKAIAKKPCATNQQINAVICKACDNEYLYYLIGFLKAQLKRCAGQTALPIISKGVFESFEGNFSCVDEQTAISGVLSAFDSLIDAEALRLESLRKLKSACLEKMFVHDGENCPRLRLSGFKGNWEQFHFGKIVERRSESSIQKGLPRVEYADIRSGEGRLVDGYTGRGNHKKGIRFQKGDVLFGKLRPYLRNNLCATFDGIAVGDFWVLHSPDKILDGGFLFRLVETESFQKVANTSVGSKMPRSDWNYVSDSIVSVPQDFEEQVAIVKFFADLDELINLAAFEQERMRYLKSACMERMFV